jgi:hypothetical protein
MRALLSIVFCLVAVPALALMEGEHQHKGPPTAPEGWKVCGTHGEMEKQLREMVGEIPLAAMISARNIPIQLYLSPKTLTWSVIQRRQPNRWCVVSGGRNFQLIGETPPTRDEPAL